MKRRDSAGGVRATLARAMHSFTRLSLSLATRIPHPRFLISHLQTLSNQMKRRSSNGGVKATLERAMHSLTKLTLSLVGLVGVETDALSLGHKGGETHGGYNPLVQGARLV